MIGKNTCHIQRANLVIESFLTRGVLVSCIGIVGKMLKFMEGSRRVLTTKLTVYSSSM